MADGGGGIERRTAQRYGCAGDAEIVVPGRGLHYRGKIGNLSAGGCFIEAECRLERGTRVEVWMSAQGQPLRLAASLLVRRTLGVGLRFEAVTERKLAQIRTLIAELEDEERRLHPVEVTSAEPEVAQRPAEIFSRRFHEGAKAPRRWGWRWWLECVGRWRKA
jgi:PilZ domain